MIPGRPLLAAALVAGGAILAALSLKGGGAVQGVATGDPALDRYDPQLVAGWQRVGVPRAWWPLLKTMALRESSNLKYTHRVHRDGIGLGMYGIHRGYFAGKTNRENPAGYSEAQFLRDVTANAEVGARLLKIYREHSGDLWTAVEMFNRGYVAKAPGGYASRTRARLVELFGPAAAGVA